MRTFFITAIAALALAGSASAQMTTKPADKPAAKATKMTPAKPAAKPAMAAPAPTTAPAMAAETPKAKKTKTASTGSVGRKPMTPESKACSAQADTKGLHGKDREKFRRECLKGK